MCECQIGVAAGDPDSVERLTEHLMREFVAARARGDRAAMYEWWGKLLTETWDRLERLVYFAGVKILSPSEREEALSNAAERLTHKVVWNFRGTTTAELRATLTTVALRACQDEQRKATRYSKNKQSLDTQPAGDDDAPDRANAIYADLERKRIDQDEEHERERELLRTGRDFLDWALPQLTPKRRSVIELLRKGYSREQVMEELDLKRNTVDQTYKRAMLDLSKLKEQYTS